MYRFIFSRALATRLARHLAFWVLYFAGTLLVDLPDIRNWGRVNGDVFATAFWDGLSLLPIYLLAVYSTMYIILPKYLRNRKLSLFVWHAVVVFSLAIPVGYYIAKVTYTNRGYHSHELDYFATALHNCMANLITIVAAAVIIKMMKDFWLRQREHELLAIENIRNKLDLLKMQMHPRILFSSLQRIYHEIDRGTSEAPEMILKLSDLLSYLLYESETETVPLSKEVQMIENYLALKKLEYKHRIDLRLETDGQINHHLIAPGLLLPLLEIGIERSGGTEHLISVIVRLRVTRSKIHFSLTNNIPGSEVANDPVVRTTLRTVRDRLRNPGYQKSKLDLLGGISGLHIEMQIKT